LPPESTALSSAVYKTAVLLLNYRGFAGSPVVSLQRMIPPSHLPPYLIISLSSAAASLSEAPCFSVYILSLRYHNPHQMPVLP
jgi:hypothetical protein